LTEKEADHLAEETKDAWWTANKEQFHSAF